MDVLRNLFGNLSAGIIRLLVTVGILAAVYFFIVRPTLDTTEKISHEVNANVQKGFEQGGSGRNQQARSTTSTARFSAKSRSHFAPHSSRATPTS